MANPTPLSADSAAPRASLTTGQLMNMAVGFLGLQCAGGGERGGLAGRFRHAGYDLARQQRRQLSDAAGRQAGATPCLLDLRWRNGEGLCLVAGDRFMSDSEAGRDPYLEEGRR